MATAQHVLRYQDTPGDERWICTSHDNRRDPSCPLVLLHDCYAILKTAARYGIDWDPNWPDFGPETYDSLGEFLWPSEGAQPQIVDLAPPVDIVPAS